jgi:hypothetical protein
MGGESSRILMDGYGVDRNNMVSQGAARPFEYKGATALLLQVDSKSRCIAMTRPHSATECFPTSNLISPVMARSRVVNASCYCFL